MHKPYQESTISLHHFYHSVVHFKCMKCTFKLTALWSVTLAPQVSELNTNISMLTLHAHIDNVDMLFSRTQSTAEADEYVISSERIWS